uniref:Uncharacterized protein n=1 Tax=Onchocerca volvulus TaxID=6282 RepID=A0A8R1TQQ7_ONCVO
MTYDYCISKQYSTLIQHSSNSCLDTTSFEKKQNEKCKCREMMKCSSNKMKMVSKRKHTNTSKGITQTAQSI